MVQVHGAMTRPWGDLVVGSLNAQVTRCWQDLCSNLMLHEPLKLHGLESAIKPRPLTPLEGVVKSIPAAPRLPINEHVGDALGRLALALAYPCAHASAPVRGPPYLLRTK